MGLITREKLIELATEAKLPEAAIDYCRTAKAVSIGSCGARRSGAAEVVLDDQAKGWVADGNAVCPIVGAGLWGEDSQPRRAFDFDDAAKAAGIDATFTHYFEVID